MIEPCEDLTATEAGLLEAWQRGHAFDATGLDDRTMRAQILRSLILGIRHDFEPPPGRLVVRAANIIGELDLSYVVPGALPSGSLPALRFDECVFEAAMLLSKSSILSLTMWGCTIPQLALMNTRIDGDLDLTGSTVGVEGSSGKTAIRGEGLCVTGRISLSKIPGGKRFQSHGPIRLLGARIGGNLEARGSRLSSGSDSSGCLVLDGAEIEGNLFLRSSKTSPFEALGCVRLPGLTVKRDVSLVGAALNGAGDHALSCHRATIGGALRMTQDGEMGPHFKAEGALNLTSMVAETVELTGARIAPSKAGGMMLDLRHANIAGTFRLRDVARLKQPEQPNSSNDLDKSSTGCSQPPDRGTVDGMFDFSGATIGTLEDDPSSFWPNRGFLALEGLIYRSIAFHEVEAEKAKSRLRWLDLQYVEPPAPDKFKPQPFEQLAKVLREHGYSQDADIVAMRKRDWAIKCRTEKGVNVLLTRIMQVVAGHGYERHAALFWTGLWWAVGIALIYAGGWAGAIEFRAADREMPRSATIVGLPPAKGLPNARLSVTPEPETCDNLVRPLYALELMVPIVEFGQVSACHLKATGPYPSVILAIRAIYQICGFLLVTVLGVTLTGLLRKD